jgi:hypothetical protein
MWKLYAESRKGVALTTTYDRLRAALKPFRLQPTYEPEDAHGGCVRYVNLLEERLNVGMLERFFYKHRVFEWEREFRVAISVRFAEEFGVSVPEKGIEVEVDLDALVEAVYIGPSLTAEERQTAREGCARVGLASRVITSSLLSRPRYT